ncbi:MULTISPECIES: flagellar biosynthesis regulator FlaF [unclassified Iodidimonas]|jgi:flagellar protein FlaF|uniref:flagellar biosynthesis regulator FlaF n=1 Tax=unclassified Iodidimonas TaxID=2626145 RepID=UPI0024824EC5|nr:MULTISPECIES: flagellar biosynthesis regulator FlaF [unclassified Iodidimonas]
MLASAVGGASAYKQTIRETENPRSIERRVFKSVTASLEKLAHEKPPFKPDIMRARNDALARNSQLWGVVLFEVSDQENALPMALRAQLINMALYVDRTTPDVVAGKRPMGSLIDLNQSIIRGLEGIASGDGGGHGA